MGDEERGDPFGSSTGLVGGVAVIVAIFFFGTQAVFVKSKRIIDAGVDPFLVVCYFSCGVFLCGATLAIILSLSDMEDGFDWTRYGLYASLFYAPGNILLLWSARAIGVGLCTGVVSSTAAVTGFLTGAFLVGDPVPSWTKALIGLTMLIIGAIGMSLTRVPAVQQQLAPELFIAAPDDEDGQYRMMAEDSEIDFKAIEMPEIGRPSHANFSVRPSEADSMSRNSSANMDRMRRSSFRAGPSDTTGKVQEFDQSGLITGLAASASAGMFLGVQGVPLSNDAGVPLRDAATFMMMQLLWTLALLGPLLRIKYNGMVVSGQEWNWHRETALVQAMLGGVCFSIAFGGQLFAIIALTASVGMPLTQLNLVIAGLWGTFYYGELKGRVLVGCFFGAAAIAVAGAPLI
jgi:glucose uptake protein GlcU